MAFVFIIAGAEKTYCDEYDYYWDYSWDYYWDYGWEYGWDYYDPYYVESYGPPNGEYTTTIDGVYYVWVEWFGWYMPGVKLPQAVKVYDRYVENRNADIPIKCILQEPELPTGCEIVSTDTVLRFLGYPISKTKLADKYFGPYIGIGDFRYHYIGYPYYENGLGCYAPAVTIAANKYLKICDSDCLAFNYSGYQFEALLNEVAKGYPVIIWATIYMEEPFRGLYYRFDGTTVNWISMEHCLVLCGYDLDRGVVKVSDPLAGIVEYDMTLFKQRFMQLGSQAVIIRDKSVSMDRNYAPREFRRDKNLPMW